MSTNHRELVFLSVLAFCWAIASRVESGAAAPAGLVAPPQVARATAPRQAAATVSPRALPPAPRPYRAYTRPAVQPAAAVPAPEVGRQAPSLALNGLIVARR
jgi:hypothetical protein